MSEQRYRVFIGVPVSNEIKEVVEQWTRKYRDILPVRWIPPRNMHITLLPPWHEETIGKPAKKLRKMKIDIRPFPVSFHLVRYGPRTSRPRLIWAEAVSPPEFDDLSVSVEQFLRRPRSKPQLNLHLTIARFRPQDFRHFPIDRISDQVSWTFTARKLVLYRSHLHSSGAEYESLFVKKLPSDVSDGVGNGFSDTPVHNL